MKDSGKSGTDSEGGCLTVYYPLFVEICKAYILRDLEPFWFYGTITNLPITSLRNIIHNLIKSFYHNLEPQRNSLFKYYYSSDDS